MPLLAPATVTSLRAALAAARAKPDAQRLAALTTVIDDLLTALAATADPVTVDTLGDVTIRGQQRITLTTGLSTLTMTSQGDIAIKGNNVSVKATSDVPINGSKIIDRGSVSIGGGKIGNN